MHCESPFVVGENYAGGACSFCWIAPRRVGPPAKPWGKPLRAMAKNGMLVEFPAIRRYVTFHKEWRQQQGKKALTTLCYVGAPRGEARNPVTWTLRAHVAAAASKPLPLPQYAYLRDAFCARATQSAVQSAVSRLERPRDRKNQCGNERNRGNRCGSSRGNVRQRFGRR